MTVYNCIQTDSTESYQKTVIHGAQWHAKNKSVNTTNTTQTPSTGVTVSFDFSHGYGNPEYVDALTFQKLASHSGYWTLDEKSGQDVIVLGECDYDITASHTLRELRRQTLDIGTITAVKDTRNRTMCRKIEVELM